MPNDNLEVKIDQNKIDLISNFSSKASTSSDRAEEIDKSLDFLKNSLLFNIDKMIKKSDTGEKSSAIKQASIETKETNHLLRQFLQKIEMIAGDIKTSLSKQNELILRKKDINGKVVSEKHFSDKRDVEDLNEGLVDQLDQLNENVKKLDTDLLKSSKDGEGQFDKLLGGMLGGFKTMSGTISSALGAGFGTMIGNAVSGALGLLFKGIMSPGFLKVGLVGISAVVLKGIWDFMQSPEAADAMHNLGGVNSIGFGAPPPPKEQAPITEEKRKEIEKNRKKGQAEIKKHYNKSFGDRISGMWDAAKEMFGIEGDSKGENISGKDNQTKVYNAFINAGFSKNQALALTAEVGRENSFKTELLFGTHSDPHNQSSNIGLFSWQGSRKTKLLNFLKSKGLIDKNGRIVQTQAALDAQAEFAMLEMKNNKEYTATKKQFLENPNIDPEQASRVLGRNYIKWRVDDPKYAHHNERRKDYLESTKRKVGLSKKQEEKEAALKGNETAYNGSGTVINSPTQQVNNNTNNVITKNIRPYIEDESYHRLMAKTGCYDAFNA